MSSGAMPCPVSLDPHLDLLVGERVRGDVHDASRRRELDGVGEEVGEDLDDAPAIPGHLERQGPDADLEREPALLDERPHVVGGGGDQGPEVEVLAVEVVRRALEPGQVEEVVDQRHHRPDVGLDLPDVGDELGREDAAPAAQDEIGAQAHRRQRRAELVGDDRVKIEAPVLDLAPLGHVAERDRRGVRQVGGQAPGQRREDLVADRHVGERVRSARVGAVVDVQAGQELAHRAPAHAGERLAEQALGLRVGIDEATFEIHDDDAVRRVREELADRLLRLLDALGELARAHEGRAARDELLVGVRLGEVVVGPGGQPLGHLLAPARGHDEDRHRVVSGK